MGISGDAFRLNMAKSCRWQGIPTFDWSFTAYRALERLGLSCFTFYDPDGNGMMVYQIITEERS
jgi:hypothetical protein